MKTRFLIIIILYIKIRQIIPGIFILYLYEEKITISKQF